MGDASSVPEAVRKLVIAWAQAPGYEAALDVLSAGANTLSGEDRIILCDEILQVSVEVLGRLISRVDDLDERPTEKLGPLDLHPVQIERFLGWLADQSDTAKALGLESQSWIKRLEQGARTSPDVQRLAELMDKDEAARLRTVGADTAKAARDVNSDRSEQAGLTGLLAARRFKKDK